MRGGCLLLGRAFAAPALPLKTPALPLKTPRRLAAWTWASGYESDDSLISPKRGGGGSAAALKRSASKAKLQSVAKASLYIAAHQPPWVVAAAADGRAGDASSDSEDERDEMREGRMTTEDGAPVSCGAACGQLLAGLPRNLISRPDPIIRELPPDREWERAERALSITSAVIIKRFYNCWGRCSHKKCTATRQVRLFMVVRLRKQPPGSSPLPSSPMFRRLAFSHVSARGPGRDF